MWFAKSRFKRFTQISDTCMGIYFLHRGCGSGCLVNPYRGWVYSISSLGTIRPPSSSSSSLGWVVRTNPKCSKEARNSPAMIALPIPLPSSAWWVTMLLKGIGV